LFAALALARAHGRYSKLLRRAARVNLLDDWELKHSPQISAAISSRSSRIQVRNRGGLLRHQEKIKGRI
jgi:hypothetical protein